MKNLINGAKVYTSYFRSKKGAVEMPLSKIVLFTLIIAAILSIAIFLSIKYQIIGKVVGGTVIDTNP